MASLSHLEKGQPAGFEEFEFQKFLPGLDGGGGVELDCHGNDLVRGGGDGGGGCHGDGEEAGGRRVKVLNDGGLH